jgi:hypothetical protein
MYELASPVQIMIGGIRENLFVTLFRLVPTSVNMPRLMIKRVIIF